MVAHRIYRGKQVARCEDGNLNTAAVEERVWCNEEGIGSLTDERCECIINFVTSAGAEGLNLHRHRGCGRLHICHGSFGGRNNSPIDEHANARHLWPKIPQEAQPLCRKLSHEKIDTCRIAARPRQAADKTELNWIVPDTEHYRYRCGRSFRDESRGNAGRRDDNVYMTTN